jgi:O-antigen chain-terminating methyltransferase
MLAEARSRGLNVRTANALDCLREYGPNSLGVVSAMHVVEHMPPEIYKELVLEAFTALAPGGLLILETPNPENLNVGANTFYLDPTHLRPVTHQYLQFLAELAGFDRVKIVRLHEDPALVRNERPVTLMDVLAGVSNDFALIAQKAGPSEILGATEAAFSRDYGLTLNDLAARYEEQRTNEISRLERSARQTISGQIKAAVRRLSPRRRKRDFEQ